MATKDIWSMYIKIVLKRALSGELYLINRRTFCICIGGHRNLGRRPSKGKERYKSNQIRRIPDK